MLSKVVSRLSVVCVNCGKGVAHANVVSHAKNRTHIIRKPNLHWTRVLVAGKIVRQRLCTKCLRKAVRPHKVAMESGTETSKK